MQSGHYRADIDGLRALAIIPVVWFHSGLPGLPGGFTGVDTFFVISGYLITALIHREVQAGQFRFSRFYQRRVRRIAPALLLVLAATSITASLLLLPYEFDAFGRSVIASLLMVPNVHFWREGGYFALGESITPLLHLWSLGVEEQFYLFFPVALIVAERLGKVKPALLIVGILSLGACIIASNISPGASFYLLPTRAWELLAGSLLAVGAIRVPLAIKGPAAAIGVAMLAAAALLLNKSMVFPGWIAAIPVLGACLVIGGGERTQVARLLSGSVPVLIGRISYSLYLWHWPIFVLMRHYRASAVLPIGWSIAGIVLAFLLAYCSYRWIEQPARRPTVPFRKVAMVTGTAGVFLAGSALVATLTQGLPQRLPQEVVAFAALRNDRAPLAQSCLNTPLERVDVDCRMGSRAGKATFLIWGDSHAAAMSEGIAAGTGGSGVLAAMNTCAPVLEWVNPKLPGRDSQNCADRNRRIFEKLRADPAIGSVFLVGYWPSHQRAGGEALSIAIERTVRALQLSGKRVYIVAGTPEAAADPPWAAAIHAHFSRPPTALRCQLPSVSTDGAILIDISAGFCRGEAAERLLVDSNHVSRHAGMSVIAPAVKASLGAPARP